jgi:hypothetical protein
VRQQFVDRIARHQHLAQRIAERKHAHAEQHQGDAGEPRGTFIVGGGDFGEEAHVILADDLILCSALFASRRMSGTNLMVRDGARAPPHHEGHGACRAVMRGLDPRIHLSS